MDKKLLRIFEPVILLYFVVMAVFAFITFSVNFWLGIAEVAFTLLSAGLYPVVISRRKKRLMKLLESSLLSADTLSSKSMFSFPLPMTVVR
ncbi:MAG: hypothetical protein IKU11_08475, partial [Clostridia bacterium]|nr:hypothetical protein [Clostridia bacterium]